MAAAILMRLTKKDRPSDLLFQAVGSTLPFSGWSKCKKALHKLAAAPFRITAQPWHWFCLLLRGDASGQPSGHQHPVDQKTILCGGESIEFFAAERPKGNQWSRR
jgi:hypothetical protein